MALYRGAVAQIHDNEIWNGRGAGIGITWDAHVLVVRNEIHGYWKGIGSFGNSRVGVYNNFVHDLDGWGIIATGTSDMICRNNTVIHCGNVGISGWSNEARIEIVNNIIAFNGTKEQWVAPRVGIWMNCSDGNYKIAYNAIHGNHDAAVAFGYKVFDDDTWSYEEEREFIGIDGNIGDDPMIDGDSYRIESISPCIDTGDPEILDPDNSRSDIGATGGPFALTQNSEDLQ
ncbi:MAG TPA: right-handed parallel beta-helix repeat-containing protein [Firmicutes bacterium]|nr:right-handed parallel beta-helix repeat-containing protein [Bacillota bacterium]